MEKSTSFSDESVYNSTKSSSVPFTRTTETKGQIYYDRIMSLKHDIINGISDLSRTSLIDPEITASWLRSRNYGVRMEQTSRNWPTLSKSEFKNLLLQNRRLIDSVISSIKRFDSFLHSNYDICLFNPDGILLVAIPGKNNSMCEQENVVPGIIWSEQTVGTASMSLTAVLKKPTQLCGSEMYLDMFQHVASASAPIFDDGGNLIGIICLGTRDFEFVNSLMLSLVVLLAEFIQQRVQSSADDSEYDAEEIEKDLYKYLFGKDDTSIIDPLTLYNYRFHRDNDYTIYIMETNRPESDEKWSQIRRFSNHFLQMKNPDAFMIHGPQGAVFIIPERPKKFHSKIFLAELEQQLHVPAILGHGATHSLHDLRRCCDEARIAVSYLRLINTNEKVQSFLDLGVFTPLLSQDINNAKAFCQKTLNPLLDHHNEREESNLLTTLKELVNSDFNLKETAGKLFIHINTLYYRIDKIEELLQINLSLMNTRVDLYIAIHTWELLDTSGLWD